jgi:glycosyltransferase involved in cell wall biosynthesis
MTPRRIAIAATEILGVPGSGGPATADSFLAIALGRRGHDVELVVAPGRDVSGLSEDWRKRYADANVRIRPVEDDGSVRPAFLAPGTHVYDALSGDPPDVVIADDWRALPYAALRARQSGRALGETAFVLYCHGPARVFAAAARKVPDAVERFGEEVAQRASFELADAVVSPSAWLAGWMHDHRWPVRDVSVIPNLWESAALGHAVELAPRTEHIRRIAFFGHLREGKGLRVFVEAVRRLDSDVEVVFIGHARRWSPEEISAWLGRPARFETTLDRAGALEQLRQPGTLAVMPSLLENSPYAVAECIEHGIPFLAADVGGTPELVAEEDRGRVLHPPTPEAFAAALADALENGVAAARPAVAPEDALASWLRIVESVTPAAAAPPPPSETDWVRVGNPDDTLVETLARAAGDADVVTCAVRLPDGGRQLFLGDAGPLGVVENHYGVVGVVRPEAAARVEPDDSPWPFFARLALAGARILSLPDALVSYAPPPATSADRLAVLEAFEQASPEALRHFPHLAATLAAALERTDGVAPPPSLPHRIRRRLLG